MARQFSKVKEVVASWSQVRQYLRSGDNGDLVPVVIPKDKRSFRPLFWLALAVYLVFLGLQIGDVGVIGDGDVIGSILQLVAFGGALFALLLLGVSLWRSMLVEIEEGTIGVMSSWGEIVQTLSPGRQIIWQPWRKVEYIVDTATEIPYTAPVLSSPTKEDVPLKSIEFFLKFRIIDPVVFVRKIGASNFDIVLSSAVQDAIRQRSRRIETSQAYSLRGGDVSDMQRILNNMMERYGVRITGANIPDVQLTDQYRDNLATQEKIAKEQVSYEKEWDLMRKRRKDALELEIEQAKKERDAKRITVNEAINKARQDVAVMLQEKETEALKIRLDIEAAGKARLKAAENEALALQRLGESYRDNEAILHYELETQRLDVAQTLIQHAPRPLVVSTAGDNSGGSSALNTLVLAQFLPEALKQSKQRARTQEAANNRAAVTAGNNNNDGGAIQNMMDNVMDEVRRRTS